MYPIYCIMFTHSLNDDVRDLLFETAYLMLKSKTRTRKVHNDFCEGAITYLGPIATYGTSGIQFKARLEVGKDDIQVFYMVRPQDLQDLENEEAEYVAWLSPEEIDSLPEDLEEKIRPNPIRRVAKKYLEN